MTTPTPPPPHEPDGDRTGDAPGRERDPGPGRASGHPVDHLLVDQAASATLDGAPHEDTADGVDPATLAGVVGQFAAVAALVAEPTPTPPTSVVDRHIEAALAAFEPAPAADRVVGPAVVPIAAHRRPRPAVGRWLAVAAAIAVVALAIPVLRSLASSSSSSHDTAATSASVASAGSEVADQSPAAPRSGQATESGASTTTAPPSPELGNTDVASSQVALGSASSSAELDALVHQAAPAATTAQGSTSTTVATDSVTPTSTTLATPVPLSSPPSCDATIRATRPELGAIRFAASAVYQSRPVQVIIYEVPGDGPTSYRLIATAANDCAVLLDQPYS